MERRLSVLSLINYRNLNQTFLTWGFCEILLQSLWFPILRKMDSRFSNQAAFIICFSEWSTLRTLQILETEKANQLSKVQVQTFINSKCRSMFLIKILPPSKSMQFGKYGIRETLCFCIYSKISLKRVP